MPDAGIPGPAGAPTETAAAAVERGVAARRAGDREQAAAWFRRALGIDPGDRRARRELATTLRELRRIDEAEPLYRALLAEDAGSWPALVGLGLCARVRRDLAASAEYLAQALALAPRNRTVRHEYATTLREQRRLDEAAAAYRALLADEPDAWQAMLGLGLCARARDDRAAAAAIFRDGAARFPDRPQFLVEAALDEAQLLADLGRLADALAALDAAAARADASPELTVRRAFLLRRAGRRGEALAVVRAAAGAMPAHFGLWFERFENERLAGDFAATDRCLAAAPAATAHERAQVEVARGHLAAQRWQLGEAAAAYREALRLNPLLPGVWEALARIALTEFDIPAARECLRQMQRQRAPQRLSQGLSPHLAHTHIGNLFDEFAIDAAALAALRAAQALPPAERIGRLVPLVRENPDHTPAAIALLIALRQAGRFAGPWPEAEPPAIPATIAQFWDEAEPPADVAGAMRSWAEQNPGFAYRRFDAAAARAWIGENCPAEVQRAYGRAREPAMRADLFRLALLFAEGGWYADADDRCLGPLDGLAPPGAGFVAVQAEYGALGNDFIGAAPLHPVLGLALRLAAVAVNRGDDDMIWLATGPGLLTRAFARTLATAPPGPETVLRQVRVPDRHEIGRVVATHCELGSRSRKPRLRAAAS